MWALPRTDVCTASACLVCGVFAFTKKAPTDVLTTVSFHNFKSQKIKLSVSNSKSKYVAYLSVLSQISNCQGLGRKNKHEILKTDRTSACLALCQRAVRCCVNGWFCRCRRVYLAPTEPLMRQITTMYRNYSCMI